MNGPRFLYVALILGSIMLGCAPKSLPPALFVRFDSGKDKPRADEDAVRIGQAVATLEREPRLKAAIIGHASSEGAKEQNRKLSFRRADRVRELLEASGIANERLTVAARGSDHPAASNDTEEGRALNRRVEIFFYDPQRGELKAQYGVQIEIQTR